MITPNKFIPLEKTALGKIKYITSRSRNNSRVSIQELFGEVEKHFTSIDEFIYALDILYLTKKIKWIPERGAIEYVN